MADYDTIMRALRNAHSAGDTAAAKRLAQMARAAKGEAGLSMAPAEDPSIAAMRERAQAAKAGTLRASPASLDRAARADQTATDRIVLESVGTAGGVAAKAVQGIPFAGEWIDEGFDKLSPGRGERLRQIQGAMDRERPKTALAAEIGGGVVASLPLAIGAAGVVGNAATKVGSVGRAVGIGATAGASEGAIAGAGRAEAGQRLQGAVTGGAAGAALGGGIAALAPAFGAAAKGLSARIKKIDVATIAEEFGLSKSAARQVKAALASENFDDALARLARGGDDAMLADAGQATGALLDAATKTGGEALSVASGRVEARAAGANTRLVSVMDDILGTPGGMNAAARDIAQRTSAARSAAYNRAYSKPINYEFGAAGDKILGVIDRVDPGVMRRAVSEANAAMRDLGIKNKQILIDVAENGEIAFRQLPDVRQLDELKKALDKVARDEVDSFGRKTAAGIRAAGQAADLRKALAEAVPEYSRALRLGGDKIAEDNALDLGRKVLSGNVTMEAARAAAKDMSMEAKIAFKRGLRESIEETTARVRTTLADLAKRGAEPEEAMNAAREAYRAVNDMSSRANRTKVRSILGSEADRLFDELDRAGSALALRATIAANSQTAIRRAIQGEVRATTQPGLVRRTIGQGGNPFEAAQEVTRSLAGIDPASMSRAERQIFAEIADALTGMRGPEAVQAMQAVRNALKGQPLKDAQAELIGRVVGGSTAALGYQGASQSLDRQLSR